MPEPQQTGTTAPEATFDGYRFIRSAADAQGWARAIIERNGGPREHVPYPGDVAVIIRHFQRVGVTLTPQEAQALWEACSEKDCAGWVGPAVDCVAGLDWIIEKIEDGSCRLHSLLGVRGWKP